MRFQAVTGASTNTPSVGGEAGPRPCARGQRTERHRGQGAEVPATQDTPRTWPLALDGCQEFWVPDERWRPLPQIMTETLLPHTAVWEPRKGLTSLLI